MGAIAGWIGAKLVSLVLPSLGTVIAGYAIAFLDRQLKKAGLDLSEAQEARIRQIIDDAIRGVEERAATQRMTSDQKLVTAIQDVQAKLPSLSGDEIVARIHQQLPDLREPKRLAQMPRKGTNGSIRN